MTIHVRTRTAALLTACLLAAGCLQRAGNDNAGDSLDADVTGTGAGIDHDADRYVPKSVAAGIEQVSQFRDEIRDALTSGNPSAAHGPLHQIPDVLEGISVLVEREMSDAEELKKVHSLLEKLFVSFTAIDARMHNQGGSAYVDVSDDIDAALAALKAATSGIDAAPNAGSESAGDDDTTTKTQD